MGVTGSGKTTIGRALAERLGAVFLDADPFHPPANVAKMSRGVPLTDEDRWPWLDALRSAAEDELREGRDVVLACSALKRVYRLRLFDGVPARVRIVYLDGDRETFRSRMGGREEHFMPHSLLQSQLDTLEPPADAIRVEVSKTVEAIVDAAAAALDGAADEGRD